MKHRKIMLLGISVICLSGIIEGRTTRDTVASLYLLDDGSLNSRSISFENPTGEPGQGGQAASNLGMGRKGRPYKEIKAGETVTLCDIDGPGTIRHIWMTGNFNGRYEDGRREMLRSIVIRAWWDGQEYPSIECPLGDFMGLAHAGITAYQSAVHSVGENAALNLWLPMPFTRQAKISFSNEGDINGTLYYQIDYTIGDDHPKNVGRLHTLFRRENPTTTKEDFELLPTRHGRGRFLGCVIGVRTLGTYWWGEGEVKIYLDGDTGFPTICGTGSEDYVCLSYGVQETPYAYHGCSLDRDGFISMYRWHILDPIYWHKSCRVTIQQIGYRGELFERSDDWSTATFWYEPIPSDPLPPLPTYEERVADLYSAKES